ncbi:unnamed protein product [marine sediment metagenome]|uniref:HTH cro/C1-type domain-containing protein n=1 Tax=marine sediment metagenome TaxID=412755 RepID=X0RJM5_9ZZZZ
MPKAEHPEICRRIAQVRLETAGPRGKCAFASQLGLSPSTYSYYESKRVPPAEVLVRIADLAGVDLRWLLTGEAAGELKAPASHPVVQRAAKLLAERDNAAAPLAAFLDILAQTFEFPQKQEPARSAEAAPPPAASHVGGYQDTSWIPVLGRSAAGVPQFWSGEDESAGLTTLNELIARHARCEHRTRAARASGEETDEFTVQVIALTAPEAEVSEFIGAAGIRACYPNAFAVRIDGESMAPDIRHGDLVVLSPSADAADGKAAVVQLKSQIGVTCKIFRREAETVHLIPINEQFAPQAYPAEQVGWALRVLARVRA